MDGKEGMDPESYNNKEISLAQAKEQFPQYFANWFGVLENSEVNLLRCFFFCSINLHHLQILTSQFENFV